ncbi:snRNP Sm family protein, partial [Gregarina niphandrodes]
MAGTIEAVDQYLNLKLSNVQVTPGVSAHYPSRYACFIRGSVIRYINLSQAQLDLAQLQSACRKMELTG